MVTVTEEELCLYCRVDDDAAGALLTLLADAAEAYLSSMGADLHQPSAALCVKALTLHWYDNPTGGELPVGLRQLINSLKLYHKEDA